MIRVRAAVRVAGEGHAQLWLREDRANGQTGLFDNMGDRPIRPDGGRWQQVEIGGALHDDAAGLSLGLMLFGDARAWLDDVTFEVLGAASRPVSEPPRPLTDRGLRNVAAFTKLLGCVRFFHPGDGVAETDWERFAVHGMRVVEGAEDDRELVAALRTLFGPLAPTVEIGAASDAFPETARPDGAAKVAVWKHHGIGLSPQSIYRSRRAFRTLRDDTTLPEPYEASLSDGVRVRVPLYVFADRNGQTLPVSSPVVESDEPMTAEDRAVRLADVALLWTVMQHFYPYFDVVEADWPAALDEALRGAAEDADECAFLETLQVLVAHLHDGHGNVSHKCAHNLAIPPVHVAWVGSQLVVERVSAGALDVAVGDVITHIDGRPVADVAADSIRGSRRGPGRIAVRGVRCGSCAGPSLRR